MSTPSKLVLYEFATKLPNGESISPFTATTRCALNYLGLPFESHLLNIRDIESVSLKLDIKPTSTFPDGSPKHTVPILVDQSSSTTIAIADSFAIVQYLDKTYAKPDQRLFTSSPSVDKLATGAVNTAFFGFIGGVLGADALGLLQDEDKPHMIQRNLGGFDPSTIPDIKGTPAWAEAVDKVIEAAKAVTSTTVGIAKEGTWIGGEKPVFVDFALLGMVNMIRLVNGEAWERLLNVDGGRMRRYWEEGKEWVRFEPEASTRDV